MILLKAILPSIRFFLNSGRKLEKISEILEILLEFLHREKKQGLKIGSDSISAVAKELVQPLVSCLLNHEEQNVYIMVSNC